LPIPNKDALVSLVRNIEFRNWTMRVGDMGDGWFLQVEFPATDTESGLESTCRGRKWYVSAWSTPEEVVKTCWLAIEVALRHEAMEDFKYRGHAIFHPHTSLPALVFGQEAYTRVHRPDPEVQMIPAGEPPRD
jgi:hypothetical protein